MTDPLDQRTRCVLGKPDEPHAAAFGLHVCDAHREKLYGQLRAIVDTVARIAIRPAGSGSPGAGRSGSLASQRSVLDLESLALAGPLAPGQVTTADGWDENHPLAVLSSWARLVREERGLEVPTTPLALTTEVDLLVRHLTWCCTQPWVDEMAEQLAASLSRVRRADPDRHRPGDEGRCPAVGLGPDGSCGGQLRRERGAVPWLIRPDRCERVPVDVHAGVVRCQRCGATWATERDERELKNARSRLAWEATRPQTVDGQAMQTARELADDHGWTLRATQLRLHRAGVAPVMDRGVGWYPPGVLAHPARDTA